MNHTHEDNGTIIIAQGRLPRRRIVFYLDGRSVGWQVTHNGQTFEGETHNPTFATEIASAVENLARKLGADWERAK